MKAKKYITQLTRRDMQEIARATNLEAGWLIRIDKDQDTIKISVDQTALAMAINGFVRNGGTSASSADCVNVPFDPPE